MFWATLRRGLSNARSVTTCYVKVETSEKKKEEEHIRNTWRHTREICLSIAMIEARFLAPSKTEDSFRDPWRASKSIFIVKDSGQKVVFLHLYFCSYHRKEKKNIQSLIEFTCKRGEEEECKACCWHFGNICAYIFQSMRKMAFENQWWAR